MSTAPPRTGMVQPLSAEEVAAVVGGRLDRGAADTAGLSIRGVQDLGAAGPEEAAYIARGADHAGRDHGSAQADAFAASAAGLFLVAEDFDAGGRVCVRVPNPQLAAAQLARHFHPPAPPQEPGVHPSADVAADAELGEGVAVGAHCTVGPGARLGAGAVLCAGVFVGRGAEIGAGTYLYPGVVVLHGVRIGRGCIVHANTVLGSDGFGYVWDGKQHVKVPQTGTVEIGDQVEIGACTSVDRGTFGATRIGSGTIIDNQVQIGHNCDIGRCVVLCGLVGLAGSTVVGDGAVLGGRSATAGHLRIGRGAQVAGGSGVSKDVPDGAKVAGLPARDIREELRARAAWRRLGRPQSSGGE